MISIPQASLAVVDFILPPRCVLCDTTQLQGGRRSLRIQVCASCHSMIHAESLINLSKATSCICCHEFTTLLPSGNCLACTLSPPNFRRAWSLFPYSGYAEEFLKRFKYAGQSAIAFYLSHYMAQFLKARILPTQADWDLIVNVPTDPEAVFKRGYCHTSFLVWQCGRILQRPFSVNSIARTRGCVPQASLPAELRWQNVANSFCVRKPLKGKSILLVDDVMTTGATAQAVAAELLLGGAQSVDLLMICRSQYFQSYRLRQILLARSPNVPHAQSL